jgi:hypothetical protein
MKTVAAIGYRLSVLMMSLISLFSLYDNGLPWLETTSYFTTLIHLLTVAVLVNILFISLFQLNVNGFIYYVYQASIILLVLTMLVYGLVLLPYLLNQDSSYPWFSFEDTMVHFVIPMLMVADYFLFIPKGLAKKWMIFINLSLPLFYLVYVEIYNQNGGVFTLLGTPSRVPYFFLNIDVVGVWNLVFIVVGLIIFIAFLGWIYYLLDQIVNVKLKRHY